MFFVQWSWHSWQRGRLRFQSSATFVEHITVCRKDENGIFLKKQLRIYWFSMAENFIILPAANPERKPYVRCQFSITKIVRYKSTKNAKRIFLGAKSVRICFNARAWIYQKLEIESVFILISSHFRALLSA